MRSSRFDLSTISLGISREITPPVLRRIAGSAFRSVRRRLIPELDDAPPEATLFEGAGALFEHYARRARVYGEYGVGASTIWMANETEADILAVDTSGDWISHVQSRTPPGRIQATLVDVGLVGEWGRPLDYRARDGFKLYRQEIWMRQQQPDLVLIDGRFRVACFVECLIRAKPGTLIIFDDYIERPFYHVIEDWVRPMDRNSRQAVFEVPSDLDHARLEQELVRFEYVMD